MGRHRAPPRPSRAIPVLGGTATVLGTVALVAALESLVPVTPTASAQAAEPSTGTPLTALLNDSAWTPGPLEIPSIGVVAPHLDDYALLTGRQPERAADPSPTGGGAFALELEGTSTGLGPLPFLGPSAPDPQPALPPPAFQPPATEQPQAEQPPATEQPAAETPGAETPSAETPSAETPSAEGPAAEPPPAGSPVTEPPPVEPPPGTPPPDPGCAPAEEPPAGEPGTAPTPDGDVVVVEETVPTEPTAPTDPAAPVEGDPEPDPAVCPVDPCPTDPAASPVEEGDGDAPADAGTDPTAAPPATEPPTCELPAPEETPDPAAGAG